MHIYHDEVHRAIHMERARTMQADAAAHALVKGERRWGRRRWSRGTAAKPAQVRPRVA